MGKGHHVFAAAVAWVTVVGGLAPSTVAASVDRSWSCEELNRRWPRYHEDLGVRWPLKSFSCPSNMSKIAEAVALIEDIKTVPGMSSNFYTWLVNAENAMDYADETQGGAMANYHGRGVITIMKPFFDSGVVHRAAMLIHEARHTSANGTGPRHVVCTQGPDKGKPNVCDTAFVINGGTGGAYSWGWSFMWHLMEANVMPSENAWLFNQLKFELNARFNSVRPEDKQLFMARWAWDGK